MSGMWIEAVGSKVPFTGTLVCSACGKDYGVPRSPYPPFCGGCPKEGATPSRLVRRPGLGDRVWDVEGWRAGFCPVATVIEVISEASVPQGAAHGCRIRPDFDVAGGEVSPVVRADGLVPLKGVGTVLLLVEWATRWPRWFWWRFCFGGRR
jgi:hypothetical protein